MQLIEVDASNCGERLDVFLSRTMPDHTRSYWQKCIVRGSVTIDGRAVKSNHKLINGETITIDDLEPESLDVAPEPIDLDILYEDADIIVINKPRGLTVHPADGTPHGTLVNALLYHCSDLSGINGVKRPGIVHRIDKDTSGVMVAAKNDAAHVDLADQIQTKTARRNYLAIVHGVVTVNAGIINGAIGRDRIDRKKMAVTPDGKPATTEFRVLERFDGYTLIECNLKTGRTHQIRVHMMSIGYPVVGDPKYGARKNPFDIEGQALHSHTLELTHPTTRERMKFIAPLPSDMENILNRLRDDRSIRSLR